MQPFPVSTNFVYGEAKAIIINSLKNISNEAINLVLRYYFYVFQEYVCQHLGILNINNIDPAIKIIKSLLNEYKHNGCLKCSESTIDSYSGILCFQCEYSLSIFGYLKCLNDDCIGSQTFKCIDNKWYLCCDIGFFHKFGPSFNVSQPIQHKKIIYNLYECGQCPAQELITVVQRLLDDKPPLRCDECKTLSLADGPCQKCAIQIIENGYTPCIKCREVAKYSLNETSYCQNCAIPSSTDSTTLNIIIDITRLPKVIVELVLNYSFHMYQNKICNHISIMEPTPVLDYIRSFLKKDNYSNCLVCDREITSGFLCYDCVYQLQWYGYLPCQVQDCHRKLLFSSGSSDVKFICESNGHSSGPYFNVYPRLPRLPDKLEYNPFECKICLTQNVNDIRDKIMSETKTLTLISKASEDNYYCIICWSPRKSFEDNIPYFCRRCIHEITMNSYVSCYYCHNMARYSNIEKVYCGDCLDLF